MGGFSLFEPASACSIDVEAKAVGGTGESASAVDVSGVLSSLLPGHSLARRRAAALPLAGAGLEACCCEETTFFGVFSTTSLLKGDWRNGERTGSEGLTIGVTLFWVFSGIGGDEMMAASLTGGSNATRGGCSGGGGLSSTVASSWISARRGCSGTEALSTIVASSLISTGFESSSTTACFLAGCTIIMGASFKSSGRRETNTSSLAGGSKITRTSFGSSELGGISSVSDSPSSACARNCPNGNAKAATARPIFQEMALERTISRSHVEYPQPGCPQANLPKDTALKCPLFDVMRRKRQGDAKSKAI